MDNPTSYVEQLGQSARRASRQLAELTGAKKVAILQRIAAGIRDNKTRLIEANALDLKAAQDAGTATPLIKRLELNDKRIEAMATAVEQIAAQTDPVGQIIEGYVRPNGLRITKMRVPLGVILFIYESRPNVTSDTAALAIKSGNAIILRGGKEAFHSNRAIAQIIRSALGDGSAPDSSPITHHSSLVDAVQLVESTDRSLVPALLKLDQHVDLVIPRGGESLIRMVVKESTIPVLKHFTGNCHIYVDSHTQSMEQNVRDVCVNAKTSYPGGAVCNAVEHILFHKDAAPRLLAKVCEDLAAKGVEIRADDRARQLYPKAKPTTDQDWSEEYLALIVGVKVVDSLDAAIDHINTYGSHHTDAILTESMTNAERFVKAVDSGSVLVNASTRFADGGEYGLGAEVGISTDKMHARGPMGATDLTTYKWIVTGDGHVR
jgi:glutamate-5-semialdehyde dehydrogenase